MINYLIIDDEYIAHDIIMEYCNTLNGFNLKKNCYDAIEAFEYLKSNEVDLLFLDLNMPKLQGFEFLKTLKNPPKVIVTTAYKEYALEGYELDIIDYLLKPFGFPRFLKAIDKLTETTAVKIAPKKGSVFVKSDGKYIQIKKEEVLFLESAGNYVKIITENEKILVREKLSDCTKFFSDVNFIQVHKSFVVVKERITYIEGNQIFVQEHTIPVGRTFKENLWKEI